MSSKITQLEYCGCLYSTLKNPIAANWLGDFDQLENLFGSSEYRISWLKELEKLKLGHWSAFGVHPRRTDKWAAVGLRLRPDDKRTQSHFIESFSFFATVSVNGKRVHQFWADPGLIIRKSIDRLRVLSVTPRNWAQLGDLMQPKKIFDDWKKGIKWEEYMREAETRVKIHHPKGNK